MSLLMEMEIQCTFCEHPNQAEVWSSINVKEDPELKDLLLGGELNMIECEACHKIFYAEHFLLYHDPDNELFALVYPFDQASEKEALEQKTQADFKQTQDAAEPENRLNYEPVLLFGLDELARIVEWDEEVNVQGEIVKSMSEIHKFPIKVIGASLSRRKKLPKVLPYQSDAVPATRASIIEGLTKLEALNDRLFVYTQTRKTITDQPDLDVNLQ